MGAFFMLLLGLVFGWFCLWAVVDGLGLPARAVNVIFGCAALGSFVIVARFFGLF